MSRAVAVLCAIIAATVVSACDRPSTEPAQSPDAGLSLPADYSGSGPGTLIAATSPVSYTHLTLPTTPYV